MPTIDEIILLKENTEEELTYLENLFGIKDINMETMYTEESY